MIFLYKVLPEMLEPDEVHIIVEYVHHVVLPNVPPEFVKFDTEVAV